MALTVFGAQSANNDVELWGTDGTTGRTFLIKNINGSGSGNVSNSKLGTGGSLPFGVVGNFAYFSATDGSSGQELWRTDGTTAGTTKVTEFYTTNGTADPADDVTGYNPQNIVAANGYIFFTGSGPAAASPGTSAPRYGIWRYDPVGNTTTFINADEGINNMISANGRVYWTYDGGSGSGMKSSDGVNAVESHYSLGFSGAPSSLYAVGTSVYLGYNGGTKRVVGVTENDVTGGPAQPSGYIATSTHVYIIGQNTNTLHVSSIGTNTATQITAAGLTFDFQYSGPGYHTPGFAALGNKLVFSNNKTTAGGSGSEVWITDGTGAGTTLLKDIVPGLNSSNPHNFITVGSSVFFQATNGNGSVELWKTDGTGAGTVLVDTLFAGGVSSGTGQIAPPGNLDNMSVVNGVLFFSFDDGVHGGEFWRSDGTAAGTLMVKDLNTGSFDSGYSTNFPGAGANFGGTGVFVGWSQANGYELFLTNGTASGTGLLKDIDPGGGNSLPTQFTLAGSKAFFSAYSPTGGTELWVTNGTPGGTVQVRDINAGTASSSPGGMTYVGSNTVYFSADNGINGHELWASDGTSAGTGMIADIDPTSSGGYARSGSPGQFVVAGGNVFFTASTFAGGRELWVTNGTAAGTHVTKEIGAGAADANIYSNIISYNNKVFFQASASGATSQGSEVWVSDGTAAGTVVLKDLNTTSNGTGGTDGSNPNDFVLANGLFFFRAGGLSPFSGNEVYVSDGTNPGTVAVTPTLTSFSQFAVANNKVFFTAQGANGQELYVTSGASATLIDIVAGASGSNANNPLAFGTKVLFSAQDTVSNGTELWISDGTLAGTSMLKNINTNPSGSSNPQYITVVGSKAYFVADDGSNGQELWVTDGTGAGTQLVRNIGPGATNGSINPLRAVDNGHLLFLANDGVSGGQELWITNGTNAGTFKVSNVFQPGGSFYTGFGGSINGGGAPSGSFTSVPGVTLGAGGETFNGTPGADFFDGLGSSDTLNGFGGNDTLRGGAANDAINGGSGFDTALFSGVSGSYSWFVSGPTTQITGTDGTDTLTGVERMQFSNASYEYRQTGFDPLALFTASFGTSPAAGGWTDNRTYPRTAADINGDGRADLLGFGSGGVYAALTTTGGTAGSTYLALNSFGAAPAAGGWSDDRYYPRTLGDINGDGKDDIVGFGSSGVYASLATSGGNFGGVFLALNAFGSAPAAGGWVSQNQFPRVLGDVNGDGLDDLVGFGGAGVYVSLATGGGTFGSVFLAAAGFGSDAAAGGWTSNDIYPRTLADINGDGREDIIGFGGAGTFAALANADGTFGATFLAYAGFGASAAGGGWSSNDLYYRTVGDIDGDGDGDLVGFASGGVFVAEGDGAGGFAQGQLLMAAFGASNGAGGWTSQNTYPRTLADIDGDGTLDILGFGSAGAFTAMSVSDWVLV